MSFAKGYWCVHPGPVVEVNAESDSVSRNSILWKRVWSEWPRIFRYILVMSELKTNLNTRPLRIWVV